MSRIFGFHNYSLRNKLITIMLLTSSIVLFITSAAFLANQGVTYRRVTTEELQALADIIGKNASPALLFNDRTAAHETLQGLSTNPRILSAHIITNEGHVFAEYHGPGDRRQGVEHSHGAEGEDEQLRKYVPAKVKEQEEFLGLHQGVTVMRGIFLEGKQIGAVVIQSNKESLQEKLYLFLAVTGAVMLVAAVIAYIISIRLQRLISEPIMCLVQTMKRVSHEKNYSLRSERKSTDEIGALIDGFNEMLKEIDERDELLKERYDHLQQLAHFDTLTRLPNRVLFYDRLTQALLQAWRLRQKVAIFFVDLDQFKDINDTLGHRIGDLLLVEVARRFNEIVRASDTVGRMGGDEFTLFLQNVATAENAALVAQKLVANIARPYMIDGHEIFITASLGITMFPDDGDTADELLKNADAAMYHVKEHGKNTHQFYSQEMNLKTSNRLALQNSLRHALERDELVLFYQPKVDIATMQMTGMEALLRWNHPELGLLGPDRFIPLAEETGLIINIGEWVLRTACRQLKEWEGEGVPLCKLAVNVSAVQFRKHDFAESLFRILQEYDVSPRLIELELTESAVMQDVEASVAVLKEFKRRGIRISIDDFGTGYSSLSFLKRFPIDSLKIDRSFIFNLTSSIDDSAIVTAIIAMAHSLNLNIIAEGVETASQLTFLSERGCHEMQGYLFSKPVAAGEMAKLILSGRSGAEEETQAAAG
jgi:diguanylate cyclase